MTSNIGRLGEPAPAGGSAVRNSPLAEEILRLIWRERRISRADIARRLDLSRSTVSELVSGILRTGLVAEVGMGPSRGGRPPILLEFQDEACVILGVDMGAAHVGVALTDLRGRVLAWEHRHHPVRDDPKGTRALILDLCDTVLASRDGAKQRLIGVGTAVPSPLDPNDPGRLSELVLPAWGGESRLEELSTRYGVPLMMDNDANLGALAERWWGAGRDVDNFAYIKVATGVGSGHVIDGKIYRGATGVAGEIGHIAIDPNGGPCICGLRGCLATLVGAPALASRAEELFPDYPESTLRETPPTLETIETAALAGDPLARRIVEEAAENLGIAVAGMINLMNPSMVILGGGLERVGDLLLEPLRETVRRRTLVSSVAASEVLTSDLGPRVVAVGAATLILEAALEDSRLLTVAGLRKEA